MAGNGEGTSPYPAVGTEDEAPPQQGTPSGPAHPPDTQVDVTVTATAAQPEDGGVNEKETEEAASTADENGTTKESGPKAPNNNNNDTGTSRAALVTGVSGLAADQTDPEPTVAEVAANRSEGSNGVSGSVLKKIIPPNPELGQGDNVDSTPGEPSEGGSESKAPLEGDNSLGPAHPTDGQGDGEPNKKEPGTEEAANTNDKRETTKDSCPKTPKNDDTGTPRPSLVPVSRPPADKTDPEPAVGEEAVNRSDTATYVVLLSAILVGILAIMWVSDTLNPPAEQKAFPQVELFITEMTTLKTRFHSQRPELWKRSSIHLERHLRTARPTEPVSLILAAGRGAERTLYCLAQGLANAFSAAHNGSVLHIDGAAAAGQDSDRVKLDIDSALQGAFDEGGERPAAVIHRFEELPPGSTLIFYRYCDHENAAYKKTFLLFTVLLEQEALGEELGLNAVEELVDDQLQRRFLSPGLAVAFDSMDLDKYSGLWSRISHLTLPVAPQPAVERDGC